MIRFTVLSFRSTDAAKVALKGMAAEQRQGWAETKPLEISAPAARGGRPAWTRR
ncbi:hypothetical protein [Streptomyces kanasensis]|uniref:hypothetical protein n=1 Tax=Streptomyces kanasensis TaxID=936756 RepID=UPI003700E7A3